MAADGSKPDGDAAPDEISSTVADARIVPNPDPISYLGTMPNTLMATLGIVVQEASAEGVVATMPITPAHHQPHGILHGGASAALAETVASIGASFAASDPGTRVVGLEINANHLRPVREGVLTAVGTPLHRGRRTQVWSVEIRDASSRLVCVSRCTLAVVEASGG